MRHHWCRRKGPPATTIGERKPPLSYSPGEAEPLRTHLHKPSISVVIPTIGRTTLHAAIDSIRRQSIAPNEIVVANDSVEQSPLSSDFGPDVREEFTGGGKGPSVARNRGVEHAQGELVAFLDDDDIWFPHHIESALQWFAHVPDLDLYASPMIQTHAKGIESSSKVCFRGQKPLIDFFYGRLSYLARRRSIPISTWVFRRQSCDLPMDEALHAGKIYGCSSIWINKAKLYGSRIIQEAFGFRTRPEGSAVTLTMQ